MKKYVLGYELFVESVKQGKMYLDQGKIDNETFQKIKDIDTSKTKKFVGWLTKQYITEPYDINGMKSYIEEYVVLSDRKLINTDINSFKSIKDFKHQVDNVNNTKSATRKELESDYDTIVDNEDLLLIRPNSFEASRKLGLTVFKHRNNEKTGQQDSAWCTTYSSDQHWDDYFYKHQVTFYYGKIKNRNILDELNSYYSSLETDLNVFAIAVYPNGILDMYDANDDQIKYPETLVNKFNIKDLLVPYKTNLRISNKQKENLALFNQEVIDGNLFITHDFLSNFDVEVKCKTINGNVVLKGDFKTIPSFFRNITINGVFDSSHNKLTSLKNSPKIVNGIFSCAYNLLENLEGAPIEVGSFKCNDNKLISLKGAPKHVKGNFECSYNKLKSLLYMPSIIDDHFLCSYNLLQNLEGMTQQIGGNIDLSDNKLTSLKGIQEEVIYHLWVSYNKLKNLEGAPKIVNGSFSCHSNQLKSLKNFPTKITGNIDISENKLTSLVDINIEHIKGDFDCSDNNLDSLIGSPKNIGGDFNCSLNNLRTLEGSPKVVGGDYLCKGNDVKFDRDMIEAVCDFGGVYKA